jgi:uncharacterized protein (DUF433 family)
MTLRRQPADRKRYFGRFRGEYRRRWELVGLQSKTASLDYNHARQGFCERTIAVNADVTSGQACIRDVRSIVRPVAQAIGLYLDSRNIKAACSELKDDDISHALAYVTKNLERKT